MTYKEELTVAKQIAEKAGGIMRQYFYGGQECTTKSDGTPITLADTKINRMVIEELARSFAADIVIGEEESTGTPGKGRRWFCDPIDGTKGFTWGVPTAMFSLALVVDGRPLVAVAYEPMIDRMYWAAKAEGAHCNGVQISVSSTKLENGIFAAISSPYRLRTNDYIQKLIDKNIDMAVFSGLVAKAVGVADGRFTGSIEELAKSWDVAAIDLIVSEAGGTVTDLKGNTINYTKPLLGAVVSNKIVHAQLIDTLK